MATAVGTDERAAVIEELRPHYESLACLRECHLNGMPDRQLAVWLDRLLSDMKAHFGPARTTQEAYPYSVGGETSAGANLLRTLGKPWPTEWPSPY